MKKIVIMIFIITSFCSCNYYYEEGYDKGYSSGKKDGYEEGYDRGKDEGYKEGYSEGKSERQYGGVRNSDIYPEGMAPIFDFTPKKRPLAERIRRGVSDYVSIDKDGNVRDYRTSYQGVGERTKQDDWVTGDNIYEEVMRNRGEN